jgi:hypothetical protein
MECRYDLAPDMLGPTGEVYDEEKYFIARNL